MELILNNDLTKNISEKLGELQQNFFNINWGQAINNAVDAGLRLILPDFIENEIIDIKNSFINNGFKEGIQTAIDVTVKKGKEILGIFTGNVENMSQAEAVAKNGGLIENVSKVITNIVNKCVKNNSLKEGIGNLIEKGKNTILNLTEKNVEKINKDQINKLNEMKEEMDTWKEAFKNQDFKKMQNSYIKIRNRLEKVMPIKNIIDEASEIENLHNLIKNNGQNFNLTDEQMELAKKLI